MRLCGKLCTPSPPAPAPRASAMFERQNVISITAALVLVPSRPLVRRLQVEFGLRLEMSFEPRKPDRDGAIRLRLIHASFVIRPPTHLLIRS